MILVILVVVVAAIGVFAYFLWRRHEAELLNAEPVSEPESAPTARPELLDSNVLKTSANPYGNPLPYDDGLAVHTARPDNDAWKKLQEDDDPERRMYTGLSEIQPGLLFNRVPDPTLMARPVYWTSDAHADIVSSAVSLFKRRGLA